MEVSVVIPDRLAKYVEYIPEDLLPEVLVNIIERDIMSRLKIEERAVESNNEQTAALLQQIMDKLDNVNIQQSVYLDTSNAKASTIVESSIPQSNDVDYKVSVVESNPIDLYLDDDDLGDFADLIK